MKDDYNYDYKDNEFEIEVLECKGNCHAGHYVGQKFTYSDHDVPKNKKGEKFCGYAFSSGFPYLVALSQSGKLAWEKKGIATFCCSDPVNTVVFKAKLIKSSR